MIEDIFDENADQNAYSSWIKSNAPKKIYAIFFTPRSGSSWLTSVLSETKAMGTPGEWFNPELMISSTRSKGARSLSQYINAISRHEIHGQIFGFEITYHQMKAVFGGEDMFMSHFSDFASFWLIRKDIVAQGISLDKMVQTGIGHATRANTDAIRKSDESYSYDSNRIRDWIRHIHAAEMGTEGLISKYRLSPIRISYEWITNASRQDVVSKFSQRLGSEACKLSNFASGHRKIGTDKNRDFADRFRIENREFLEEIHSQREAMLAKHP